MSVSVAPAWACVGPPPAFAITRDLPVIPADDPRLPPPGPDFLAEAGRLLPSDDAEYGARALALVEAGAAGGAVPAALDNALWRQQARSQSEKQRGVALRKAERLLREEAEASRAGAMARVVIDLYRRALYEPGFVLPVSLKRATFRAHFVPGHCFGDGPADRPGPRPARVMVVTDCPRIGEARAGRHGGSSHWRPWFEAVEALRLDVAGWYLTAAVRHPNYKPKGAALAADWVRNGAALLAAELGLVRPEYVLCLGAVAGEAVLGHKVAVGKMRGLLEDLALPGEPAARARVMVIPHPGAAAGDPKQFPELCDALGEFAEALAGRAPQKARIARRRHVVLYRERELAGVVDAIVAETAGGATIALDAEWHGDWYEPDGWLRTIQFSHRAGEAYCVALRHEGGRPAFKPGVDAALPHLRRLCKSTPGRPVRVGGHFFRADLPWLIRYGLDLRDEFAGAADPEATRHAGGFDTGSMLHAVYEDAKKYELEAWANRLCGIPRYDGPIDEAIAAILAAKGIKKHELGGYGDIPDAVLHPYACLDADAARELFDVLNGVDGAPGLLDRDAYGLSSRRAYWLSHLAAPGFLEMEMAGVRVDRGRLDRLSVAYLTARNRLIGQIREEAAWPTLNVKSVQQVRELLFGERHNGAGRRLRPEGALSLGLEPIKASGSGLDWCRIVERDEEDFNDPATDKEVLGILGHRHPLVAKLRDLRFVMQVTTNPLRTPLVDEGGRYLRDAAGHLTYDDVKGLPRFISSAGRVHTTFHPLETGRAGSRNPPMQCFAKRREDDYARILGDLRPCPMRAMVAATPGRVLVEADFKLAEVAALAWLSGDPGMMADAELSMLDKSHPDYMDLHVKTAIEFFKLDCAPTKKALKDAGHAGKRVGAKNVRFGVPYGRGAESILRQCLEEGADITLAEVEELLEAYRRKYATAIAYLEGCARRVHDPGYLVGVYGRPRRFGRCADDAVMKAQERQAYNAPIQNCVADNMQQVMAAFADVRREAGLGPGDVTLLLNAHDALIVETRPELVAAVVDDILPEAMTRRVPIAPADFDGNPLPGRGPFRFGIDVEVCLNWGEAIPREAGLALGIPADYLADEAA